MFAAAFVNQPSSPPLAPTCVQVSHGQLRRYGTACDLWSVGVIVYILLSAAPPFYGKTDAEMNRRIKQGFYRFPDKYWSHISGAAKDLIGRLLTVDPARRMTAAEALQHDWVMIGAYCLYFIFRQPPADLFRPGFLWRRCRSSRSARIPTTSSHLRR